jgi:hypothetical protein
MFINDRLKGITYCKGICARPKHEVGHERGDSDRVRRIKKLYSIAGKQIMQQFARHLPTFGTTELLYGFVNCHNLRRVSLHGK